MTTRPATLADLDTLVRYGQAFRAEVYADELADNPERMRTTAQHLIQSPDGLLLVTEDETGTIIGMIGMLIYMHHLSWEKIASEVFWYVVPAHRSGRVGILLLRSAEAWAVCCAAERLQLIAPNDAVASMYTRMEYRLVERFYQKRLAA